MDIVDRIKELRGALKLKQYEMSTALGLKQGSLSDIERRKTKAVSDTIIKLIVQTYSVNEDWLRTGEGEMFVDPDIRFTDSMGKVMFGDNPFKKKVFQLMADLSEEQWAVIEVLIKELAKE